MKLIVEGPDGSGKTTLIERLGLKRLHLKSLRGGVGGTTQEGWGGTDEAPLAYAKQLMAAPEGTAFDRFYLSEMVYGPLLRGESAITEDEARLVRRVTSARGIGTVICLPPFRRTVANVMEEGRERPDYQTHEFLRAAYIGWCRVSTDTGAHEPQERYFTHFNYTREDHVERMVPMLGIHQERVIGSLLGHVMVVTTDDLDFPALSMNGGSGVLNQSLWAAGFRETDLTFTNALAWANHDRGVRMAVTPMTKIIIAVGKQAEELCLLDGLYNGAGHTPIVFTVADPSTTNVIDLTSTLQAIHGCISHD